MRTTVTLDTDVETLLRKAIRQRGKSFKQVLNEGLRRGLRASQDVKAREFVQKTYRMGPARVDLTKALSLAYELEDQDLIRKYQMPDEAA